MSQENVLTVEDKNEGWMLLFDGEASKGWRGFNKTGFPDKLHEWQKTGSDYAMYIPGTLQKKLKAVGEWNSAQIIYKNGHVGLWLNGYKTPSGRMLPPYGRAKSGYIGLQDHDSMIWFKNIKIKPL